MGSWKMILGAVLGSLILVGVMVWGLTKMGGEESDLIVDVERLVDGAGWVKETCLTSEQISVDKITQSEQSLEATVPMNDFMSDEKQCDYKVTVVEFADLQCSACKQAEVVVQELKQMNGVRYVYRHFPLLTIHKNAWRAALAAEGAKKAGKGWEMVELLFEKQEDWAESSNFDEKAVEYAKELGLDEVEFEKILKQVQDDGVEDQVVKDNALANELKLGGTPTFFVEGEQVASSFVLTRVKEILENK